MNFFYGTYGFDLLSIFLILLGAILNIFNVTYIFGIFLTFFAIYRAFSKNHAKRKHEYNIFRFYTNKILSKFGKSIPENTPNIDFSSLNILIQKYKTWFYEKQNFKITKCPSCRQKLRLPRGKGKIIVTCKKCSYKFDMKT